MRRWAFRAAVLLALGAGSAANAVTLKIDYTYDGSKFFSTGNPAGPAAAAQAKAALEAAASFYSTILTDDLSAIQAPPNFTSTAGGKATYKWTMGFLDPSDATKTVSIDNPFLPADEYRIYAGARSLAGTTIGVGGFAVAGFEYAINGAFNSGEGATQQQKAQQFVKDVTTRGESSGFAAWGGTIAFDLNGANWHYDHTTLPALQKSDFYSVAIHELGHALGLGGSDQWKNFAKTPFFTGPNVTSLVAGNPPLAPPNPQSNVREHWAAGTMSTIFGTMTPQEASLDPDQSTGARKRLTALDAAALKDIGWSVMAPPTFNPADFNEDSLVNAADLSIWKSAYGINSLGDADEDGDSDGVDFLFWQRQFRGTNAVAAAAVVPEPTSLALAALGLAAAAAHRRRQAYCRGDRR